MIHFGTEEMRRVWRKILDETPPEERLEGLTAEDCFKGLPAEELERLRQLLQKQANADASSPSSESNPN